MGEERTDEGSQVDFAQSVEKQTLLTFVILSKFLSSSCHKKENKQITEV